MAREARENCQDNEMITNIKFIGYLALKIKGKIVMNSIKEAIRIADAEDSLRKYVKKKYKYSAEFIDIKAINVFSNKGVTASIITCSHGYNHYSMRNTMIN